MIAVVDDAYYGLFYEDVYTQSIFTALSQVNSHNILPVRLDGATKNFCLGIPCRLHDFWY